MHNCHNIRYEHGGTKNKRGVPVMLNQVQIVLYLLSYQLKPPSRLFKNRSGTGLE